MKKCYRYRPDLSELPDWLRKRRCPRKKIYLSGRRILPKGITGKEKLTDIIEETFLAYNSARLRQACELFVKKYLKPKTIIGMSLAGALTPAGLGCSCIVPLIKAGFVDWIVATGANMYHDLHFAFNFPLYVGSPAVDDADLRKNDVVRIYDIFLGYTDCLCATDEILRSILIQPEFQKEMGTAEFYHHLGKYAAEWEGKTGNRDVSVLAAAYRCGVPIHTSSPGDSTIGMNIAGLELKGLRLRINPSIDVNETTSYVLYAKRFGGESGVVLIGGGSPKNFMLQTEPQIQEILMLSDVGQDYFIQITDARPDTGGLSGATPHEAVSWGKVDPNRIPDAIVCYLDATVALPLLTHYALAKHKPRKLHRLYDHRAELLKRLKKEFFAHTRI
ncbi:MAG: homospermidine biosynthesis protein [bacterium]